MKKFILAFLLFAFCQSYAQTTVLSENFENLPISFTSSGSSSWNRSTTFAALGSYSDSARIVSSSDSAILTTPSFSTVGFSTVFLKFDQICKIAYGDLAQIEYSVNNGTSWSIIPSSKYLGSGAYSAFTCFNSLSYTIWDATNNNSIPTNQWWQHEEFDISTLVGNSAQVMLRFKLKDADNNGSMGAYGWLLDNVVVIKAISELYPPSINMITPIVQDTVNHTGPYDIYAVINDSSGISAAYLIYTHGSITDTVNMVLGLSNSYKGTIPSFNFDSSFCYRVVAIDNSLSHNIANYPGIGCLTVVVKKSSNIKSVGLGTASNYYCPLYIDNGTLNKYSNHISIFSAADLGFAGTIKKIAWNKSSTAGFSGPNSVMRIYLKHTSLSSVPSTFSTELSGATLVYENTNQQFPATMDWMQIAFNQSNFMFDGTNNLMILVEFYHPNASTDNITWYCSSAYNKAVTFYGATTNPTTTIGTSLRPNIKMYYDTLQYNYDIACSKIVNPLPTSFTSGNTDFKVRIENTGLQTITKAQINWKVDGVLQTPYSFVGNIVSNLKSGDITIGTKLLNSGLHQFEVWTSLPNDSIDQKPMNDTLKLAFYTCTQTLNGTYTIGNQPSADFHSFLEVATILKNCGIAGPTTFNVLPGIYNERVSFDTIVGVDSVNTVVFQSSTSNPNDVIIQSAGAAGSDYIVRFAKSNYITFKNMTIKNTSTVATTCVSLINSSNHITIKGCKLFSYRPTADAQAYVVYSNGNNNYLTLEKNEISGGHYGVYINGLSLFADSVKIIGNKVFNSYRVLVSITATKNLYMSNNLVTGGHLVANYFAYNGITISNSTMFLIEKNNITMELQGSGYGFDLNSCPGNGQKPNEFRNNFISVNGATYQTYNSQYCIHLNGNVSYVNIYNNSCYLDIPTVVNSAVYYESINSSSLGNINFVNNAVANMSGGNGLNVTASSLSYLVNSRFDYNCYYSNGGACVNWGGTSFTAFQNISLLTALNQKDSNSIFANPKFYSPNNLHSFSSLMNNKGTSIIGLTDDYDYDLRSTSIPDIGADEYSVSETDAGIISIIQPLPIDTQNKVVVLKAIVQNFGTSPKTIIDAKYQLNNGTPISATWTGTLLPGNKDTINFGTFTIPALNYTIKAYTTLTGDTLKYNDTTTTQLYGSPLINLYAKALLSPVSGCNKTTQENIKVRVLNQGVGSVLSGASISYKVDGMSNYITENITTPIAAGDSLDFTFSAKHNMFVGYIDSVFNFTILVNHPSDLILINDTLRKSVSALGMMPSPIVVDTTINYGTSAQLTAQSNNTIRWYSSPTATTPLSNNTSYTTPLLFDTTTYYAEVLGGNPPQVITVGNGTQTNGQYGLITPYGPAYSGTSRQQYLFLASELQSLGMTAGNITSLAFYLEMVAYTDFTPWELRIGTTNQSNYGSTFFNGGTIVYTGTINMVSGWNQHVFSTPFAWDGVSNIYIDVCTPGKSLYASPVRYTTTTFTSVLHYGAFGTGACTNTGGTYSTERPNVRFTTSGSIGCSSLRVPLKVNVILPAKDLKADAIINPISDCNIASSAVTARFINMGTDTIPSGFTASYKINNGAYSSPVTVNSSIAPADTLNFTFPNLASLPSGTNGLKYVIKAVVMVPNDSYNLNDTATSDSIFSKFTPTPPVVSNFTVAYGQNTNLTATAVDTVFWYADPLLNNQLGFGSTFNAGPIFDTTIFYATGQRMTPLATYSIGVAKGANASNTGPSPYGALSRGSKNQFLIRANELRALGVQKGQLQSIAFNVQGVKGGIYENYTISLGQTTDDSLTSFVSNLTPVYNQFTFTEVAGWNTHNFIQPFIWDGTSNLVVQTCFKNYSSIGGYAQIIYDSLSYNTSAFYDEGLSFDCSYSTPDVLTHLRPLMKFSAIAYGDCSSSVSPLKVSVSSFPNVDGGLLKIKTTSNNLLSNSVSDVKVILKNFGLNNLTNATINWTENGVSQNTYNWTGTLLHGQTDTITISANHVFAGGPTKIKATISVTSDAFIANDTAVASFNVCMHDTFNIGINKRFTTFNQALTALNTCGICGPVTFLVDSGYYNEQLLIGSIVGISPQNTVTFMGANADSTYSKLSFVTTQASNYVVQLKNASYINFKKLSIAANASTYANVIYLTGTSNNITIANCVLSSAQTSSNNNNIAISNIYGEGANISNISILNNVIKFGWQSIYFNGTSAKYQKRITANGNIISNFGSTGIYCYYIDSTEFLNNTITSNNSESYYYGIRWMQSGVYKVGGNKIHLLPTLGGYGIYPWNAISTASNPSLMFNNSVVISTGNGQHYGLYLETNSYAHVVYNSVNIISGSNTSRALSFQNGTGIKVINNNLVNYYGYTLYTNNPSGISECSNNNYYTSPLNTTNFAYWTSAKSSLAVLQSADPTKNLNCISVNPYYYANTNLHVYSPLLNAKAIPFAGVTTDFEGQARNTSTPDIGVDEFTPANNDIGVTEFLNPSMSGCGLSSNDSVKVRIFYYGTDTLNFGTNNVQVQVNVSTYINSTTTNSLLTKTLNTGTLAPAGFMDVVVANNFNLSANGKYTFIAKTVWALDTNIGNNSIPPVTIVSYPEINSFPFNEGFESGHNISFQEAKGVESMISIDNSAASTGSFGLHLQGGTYNGWGAQNTVNQAFASHTHVAKAFTCQVNATSAPYLSMRFDLKQTNSSSSGKSSWFRVLVTPQAGVPTYVYNSNGDSVFNATTPSGDPFTNQIFNLNAYAGTNFTISLEAANCYGAGVSGSFGDNVYIDNFSLYIPQTSDAAAKAIINLDPACGKTGLVKNIKFSIENLGTDSIDTIPVAYRIDNGIIHRDTIYQSIAPNSIDTIQFSAPFTIINGIQNIIAFTELPIDASRNNDTLKFVFKGLKTYNVDYIDNFDVVDDWFATGFYDQWELGTPNKVQMNAAASAPNAWVTKLIGPYVSNGVEYLYSPYITIPVSNDTATLEFQQNMSVVATKAYGRLQYSFDNGNTWLNSGWIGDPLTTNWYNTNINGLHVWSSTTGGWVNSSIKLDPAIFNNGIPFTVRFIFKSEANQVVAEGWAIDNFKVSIKLPAIDAGVTAVITPTSPVVLSDSITVKARFKNFGSDTLINMPISYAINNVVKASETWTGSLFPGMDTVYTFTQRYKITPSDNKLCVYTKKTGDVNVLNDTSCINLTVNPATNDVGITQIIAPVSVASTINQNTVIVKIKNFGSNSVSNIPVSYKRGATVIANETYSGTLAAGATIDYTFTTTYLSGLGSYQLCAKTVLANDSYTANDELCSVIVGSGIDELLESEFYLLQNKPNPTSGITSITYYLPNAGDVRFSIFNVLGETVLNENLKGYSGENNINVNLSSLNSGVYYYVVEYNNVKRVKKLAISK